MSTDYDAHGFDLPGMTGRDPAESGAGITDAQIEWREQLGQRLMLTMTCQHGSDYFGTGAVCKTCFANVQRIGHLIERIAAQAWDQGRASERRDWEFTADLSAPDEDRQPWTNPYRVTSPAEPAFEKALAEVREDYREALDRLSDDTPATPAALDDWGHYPYDHKSIAEIIYDFAVLRGDLSEEYARSQLVAAIERKVAHATRPTTPVEGTS